MNPESKKIRSDAILLNLSEEQQALIIEWCDLPKKKGGGFSGAVTRIYQDFGIKVSSSRVGDFYHSWQLRQRMRLASNVALNAQELMRSFNPEDAEKAEQFGQHVFNTQSIAANDPKTFIELQALQLKKDSAKFKAKIEVAKLEHEREKFKASLRTKLEEGLNALYEEIKSIPAAVVIYEQLKGALKSK